jgi:hypothetical protein
VENVWTIFKDAFKEWIKKWWFVGSFFVVPLLGFIAQIAGFTISLLGNNDLLKSTINYQWFSKTYTQHFLYPSTTQYTLSDILKWFAQKSFVLFAVFLVLYVLLGVVPSYEKQDLHHRNLMLRIFILFFIANILFEFVYMFVMKQFNPMTLQSNTKKFELVNRILMWLFSPFSTSNFITIGLLSILLQSKFTGKSSVRIIFFLYVISFISLLFSIPLGFLQSHEPSFVSVFISLIIFIVSLLIGMYSIFFYVPLARDDTFKDGIDEGFGLARKYPDIKLIYLGSLILLSLIGIGFYFINSHVFGLSKTFNIINFVNYILEFLGNFIVSMLIVTIYELSLGYSGEDDTNYTDLEGK